ncbi:MAG TPA: hypothetical protein VFO09_07410, partial [Methyloceanibacter sp.]|nr:hypothetical protein [Methyloceanibacter sp.]
LYDEIQESYLPEVVSLYRNMVISEDLIQKDIEQARRKAEQERAEQDQRLAEERAQSKRIQMITWSIAGISAVIALGSLTVAILTYLWRVNQVPP